MVVASTSRLSESDRNRMRKLVRSVQAVNKPDMIHSWVSQSDITFDDTFNHPAADGTFTWTPDSVAENWPEALSCAAKVLMTGRTKVRVSFMTEQLVPLAKHAGES
jgi:hypothetical protein